jgi:hypothetical protein
MKPRPTLKYFPASTSADFAGLKRGSIYFLSASGNPETCHGAVSCFLFCLSPPFLLDPFGSYMMRAEALVWQFELFAKTRQFALPACLGR